MEDKDFESHLMQIRKEVDRREERLRVVEGELNKLIQKRERALVTRSDNPLMLRSSSALAEDLKKQIADKQKARDEITADLLRAKEREKSLIKEMQVVRGDD